MTLVWKNFKYFKVLDEYAVVLYSGSRASAVAYLQWCDISKEEIEKALKYMNENGDNYAEFGVLRNSFIFSSYKSEYDTWKECN